MPIHRCCVEGCRSKKPQVKLFNLPTNDALQEIWMQYLMRHSPVLQDLNKTKESLTQRKVCILHFEKKYLIGDKRKRLSCPTLFSEEEILSCKPSSPIEFSFDEVHIDDHSYSFQSEYIPGPSIQQFHQNEVAYTTLRQKHVMKDHTYALKISKKSKPDGNGYTIHTTEFADANHAAPLLTGETHKISSSEASSLQIHLNEEKSDRDDGNEVIIEDIVDMEPAVTEWVGGPFTWQQRPYVFRDDNQEVSDDESSIEDMFPRQQSPLAEPRHISTEDPEPLTEHTDYVCNECDIPIYGARYKCVQCNDYDVCVECEARGVHATHYVLRVPHGSPQDQVRRVLDAIKRCLDENEPEMMIPEVEEIKDEIKEETSDGEERDPLHAFDDQQVPKPGDTDINQEDRAQHARLKTNVSSSKTHHTVTDIIRKTDSNILRQTDSHTLRQTDSNILHETDSNIVEQNVNDSHIINHSDVNLTNPINTYYLLDTNDINISQEIDKSVVSCQTDNNIAAQTNTYFLYENVLYQTDPTLIRQTSTNVTDQTITNLITQTDINELIYLTGTKEVTSDSSDISNSSKPLNQKRLITPVKRDIRGNLLLNILP